MKRFNSSKVRALGNLQSKTEKQKAYTRRVNGIKVRWSQDRDPPAMKKSRDFKAPVKADFIPVNVKRKGRNGCRMSAEARAKLAAHHAAREAFFGSV